MHNRIPGTVVPSDISRRRGWDAASPFPVDAVACIYSSWPPSVEVGMRGVIAAVTVSDSEVAGDGGDPTCRSGQDCEGLPATGDKEPPVDATAQRSLEGRKNSSSIR